ncbi:MAG: hypothetical protein AABY22_16605 [Nanoarchaeota archaeon]
MDNAKTLNESIETLSNNNFNTSIIIDNKLCFELDNKFYRVKMPNQSEQSFAEHKRNIIQLEYLKQEGCITKTQLIEDLKNKNIIDFNKQEKIRENLIQELKQLRFFLATKGSREIFKIEEYTTKINEIENLLKKMAIEMAIHLNPCLESRIEKFYIEYITFLCTEYQENNEWKRIWNTFEDFNKDNSSLCNRATSNMTWLMLNRG